MEESNNQEPGHIESYLGEVQLALETGIRSCQTEKDVELYYNSVMAELMNKKLVSSHAFGQAEITDEHIGLTFAYRPNVEYFHVNDLAEQPRFVFLRDKRKSMSIEDMVSQMDQTMEEIEEDNIDVKTEEDEFNDLLGEVEDMLDGEDNG